MCVLHFLAWVAHLEREGAQRAFNASLTSLGFAKTTLDEPDNNWRLSRAMLETLLKLQANQRHQFVKVCRLVIDYNGKITVAEGELYRVVACFLEVPAPPLAVTAQSKTPAMIAGVFAFGYQFSVLKHLTKYNKSLKLLLPSSHL
ncbi:hypothetical protein [Vibrio caribbeanicus]|uniref:hypothetical protein n=1 Tax=Vibrio caribbeanicus TaxID=701175 RepID=UPI0030D8D531